MTIALERPLSSPIKPTITGADAAKEELEAKIAERAFSSERKFGGAFVWLANSGISS